MSVDPPLVSELLSSGAQKFDTITVPGYRVDDRDCRCAGPLLISALRRENPSTTVPE
jgi:hypothetical protein